MNTEQSYSFLHFQSHTSVISLKSLDNQRPHAIPSTKDTSMLGWSLLEEFNQKDSKFYYRVIL